MKFVKFIKQIFTEFSNDHGGQLSAAFAYYSVFAIGPLLLVIISMVGFIFGEKAVSGELYAGLASVVGPQAAKTIQTLIANIHTGSGNFLALALGTIGLILSAAGLTSQLQNAFDQVFGVVPDPEGGIKRTVYTKLKNVGVLFLGGLVIAASFILSAVINAVGHSVQQAVNFPPGWLEAINNLGSVVILMTVIYMIYKVVPNVIIPRRIVAVAAIIITILFIAAKFVLASIIGRNGTAGAYGAAASLVILLLWFFYAAQVLLLGAEGIRVYSNRRAIVFKPKKYTMKRRSLEVHTRNDFAGRVFESFSQGFNKQSKKARKKL
jgi:membrane protein